MRVVRKTLSCPVTWSLLLTVQCVTLTGRAATVSYTAIDLYTITALPGGLPPFPARSDQAAFGGQVVGGGNLSSQSHATLWTSAGIPVDLHPQNVNGILASFAVATDGIEQIGYGETFNPQVQGRHALLWRGSAASVVDLTPTQLPGYTDDVIAQGVGGNEQVGAARGSATGEQSFAVLWRGSPQSVVVMNPAGFRASFAMATNGSRQVGDGVPMSSDRFHALLWDGTAASAVDLNPTNLPGVTGSGAHGISPDGRQQVGGVSLQFGFHAVLWNGTANSAVDLDPTFPGVMTSIATATNGTIQAGYAQEMNPPIDNHALAWAGTAGSCVDLQSLLPPNFVGSMATGVDAGGDVFGVAHDTSGRYHAIEWVPVPEPSLVAGLIGAGFVLSRRRAEADANLSRSVPADWQRHGLAGLIGLSSFRS